MITKTYIIGPDSFFNDAKALNDIFTLLGTASTWSEFHLIPKLEGLIIENDPEQIHKLEKILYPYSSIILDCLTINPNIRPTAENLLNIYFSMKQ